MTNTTKGLFDELVKQAESLLAEDDWAILKSLHKDEAVSKLHLSLGARMRDALGLWSDAASTKLDAINEHANQGVLIGYDADGGSTALLEYLWDKIHVQR